MPGFDGLKPFLIKKLRPIGPTGFDWHRMCMRWGGEDSITPGEGVETSRCTMMTMIRPNLTILRRLPTIHQVSEAWGRLELKLETADTRYWLTTEGVARKTTGMPINYVIDYVTVEKRADDGSWDLKAVYSPEAWKLSQGFDYCQMLYQELERLNDELDDHFSWDTVRSIEQLERELDATHRAVFELSEKVRQCCA
jgi:hypothetical protein